MQRPNFTLRLALLVLLFTACQPVMQSEPVPTPVVWEIQYTPALSWMGPDFSACIAEQPHASIVVFEEPATALDPDAVDFAFRWGSAQEIQGYAAIAGRDEVVFIVHPDNPVEVLTQSNLVDIYAGAVRSWSRFNPSGSGVTGRIHIWGYPTGSDLSEIFTGLIADTGQHDAVLFFAPDPQAMLEAISQDPVAIGFIPRRWLDERVGAVIIEDMEEEDLQQPILALSRAEPERDRRAWLLCVQERLSVD
jgi:hypothetical protein